MRTLLAITLGVVLSLSAQASSLAGSVAGRAVNAAGGAVANQRVDLVRGGQVVNVAVTDARGTWSFANVAAGEYTVRTSVNGKLAGVRVTVAEGAAVIASAIVVPTAAVAPQFGALSSIVASLSAAGASGAAAAVTSALSETEATDLNAEEIVRIFNSLPLEDQVLFATAVVQATAGSGDNANAFNPVPTALGASTAGVTNSTTNQAVFNVLNQVSAGSLPSATTVITIRVNPSTGQNPGTVGLVGLDATGSTILSQSTSIASSVS